VVGNAPRGLGEHHGGQVELGDVKAGSENRWRRPATRGRSQRWMVKKWLTASGLLSDDDGSRRCSTQRRFSGAKGRRLGSA
jgi:hypothetical protein